MDEIPIFVDMIKLEKKRVKKSNISSSGEKEERISVSLIYFMLVINFLKCSFIKESQEKPLIKNK